MALVPSSSLWSSIKIPFCLCTNRKIAPTIPYVVSCKDLKQRSYDKEEPAGEMVSLKLPTPLSKAEESPLPRPFSAAHKKRTSRRCSGKSKAKQVGCVVVPGGSNDWEEICSSSIISSFEKAILKSERATSSLLGEDFNLECPEFDSERVSGDPDYIPSVKPWTKERDGVTIKYRKTVKVTEGRKPERDEREEILSNLQDGINESSNARGQKVFQGLKDNHNKELQKPTSKVKEATIDSNHYGLKLAELHSTELDLKSKLTLF